MNKFTIIAGPCSIENEKQINKTTTFLAKNNIEYVRGGAFKPRTSPESFQGLGEDGIKLLTTAAKKNNQKSVSEIMNSSDLELFRDVDVLQVGARNMQNFELLKVLAKQEKPVLLKRGMACNVEEVIAATKYLTTDGKTNIVICERGIRTFENSTRFTLDLNSVLVLKKMTKFNVIVDPSHAAGDSEYVIPLALAAKAVGADGIIVEVHPDSKNALSDNNQQLSFEMFENLLEKLDKISV